MKSRRRALGSRRQAIVSLARFSDRVAHQGLAATLQISV